MTATRAVAAAKLNDKLEALSLDLIDRGFELGLQVAVYWKNDLVVDLSLGKISSAGPEEVKPDTPFPVCSTGKGIAATLLHILHARGLLDYERKVVDYWPEYGVAGKENTTVRQALSHQAGIPQLPVFSSFEEIWNWDTACAKVAALTPLWAPGSTAAYHAFTWGWLAGKIAESAAGKPFGQLLREFMTGPLGIDKELYFGTDDDAETRVAAFEPQPVAREQCTTAAAVHEVKKETVPGPLMDFVNLPGTRRACIPAVNGIMTAGAIAKVYAALVGRVDGVSLLPGSVLEESTRLQTPANVLPVCFGHGFGLGYVLKGPDSCPGAFFGHGGAGGSEGMANRQTGLAIGLVKNRMDTHHQAPGHTNRLIIKKILDELGYDNDGGFYRDAV